jgi:hypothetical protein
MSYVAQARKRKNGRTVVVINPLRKGWSRTVIGDNISELRRKGYPPHQAVAISLQSARAYFKQRYPKRKLPDHLRSPRRPAGWTKEHGVKRKRKKR